MTCFTTNYLIFPGSTFWRRVEAFEVLEYQRLFLKYFSTINVELLHLPRLNILKMSRSHKFRRLCANIALDSYVELVADVCWRILTYAHVCSPVLTYAHVCSRMLIVRQYCPGFISRTDSNWTWDFGDSKKMENKNLISWMSASMLTSNLLY